MLFHSAEMNVQLMEMLQEHSKRCALGHLGKGIHVLGEALAAIAVFTIGTRNVCVGIIDITRKKNSSMHLAPVGTHLLIVFSAGIEVSNLIGTKHIVHVLGQLGLQRCHHGELLADENLGEQIVRTSEHHRLFLEVLDMGAFGKELWHLAHLVASLFGKAIAGTRENSGSDKDRNIRKV